MANKIYNMSPTTVQALKELCNEHYDSVITFIKPFNYSNYDKNKVLEYMTTGIYSYNNTKEEEKLIEYILRYAIKNYTAYFINRDEPISSIRNITKDIFYYLKEQVIDDTINTIINHIDDAVYFPIKDELTSFIIDKINFLKKEKYNIPEFNSDIKVKEIISNDNIQEDNTLDESKVTECLNNIFKAVSENDRPKVIKLSSELSDLVKTRPFKGQEIAADIGVMLHKKNTDYGSAVYDDYLKFGITSLLVLLNHKMLRLINITKNNEHLVENESVIDTLKDLAGYAICGLDALGYMHNEEVNNANK